MAKVRLKVTIDESTVERARRFCERHGGSISRLVGDFLSRLPLEDDERLTDLRPITKRLCGIAKGGGDENDYHRYLLEKYSR